MKDRSENTIPLIVETEDGSETIISPIFNERYHSIHGAKTESEVVFINAGLGDKKSYSDIHILEMGFGTGLNALLSWLYAEENQQKISYTGYEKFPVKQEITASLNYDRLLHSPDYLKQLHEVNWNELISFNSYFSFKKIQDDIHHMKDTEQYDVIFYDAFAPAAQEELWSVELFTNMYQSLKENGILVTYCAKGQVKRNLKEAGFIIEPLPGPPGKREMTRGRKMSI